MVNIYANVNESVKNTLFEVIYTIYFTKITRVRYNAILVRLFKSHKYTGTFGELEFSLN